MGVIDGSGSALADIVDQPGLSALREAVASATESLPGRRSARGDAVAGLNAALASVPDGMASGLLVGVNPIYGLYACIAGPIAGGVTASTQRMIVATTSAAALGAGQALGGIPDDKRPDALFLMVVLMGAFQIVFGLLRLGRLTRFVSYSVMTGFVTGIAVRTVLTQLPMVTGYQPDGATTIGKAIDLITHVGEVNLVVVSVAVAALMIAVVLGRTRIGNLSTLVAIVVPSAAVALLALGQVPLVRDIGDIPSGLPLPQIPSLSALSPEVVTGALAIAIIVLVQGTGVSQSVPNVDGSRRSISRDFIGQGAANVASGLFRGLPVGGSLSTTALMVVSGAQSRLAPILAGAWMAIIVVVLSGLVSQVAMPTLAMVLILATLSTVKPRNIAAVWAAGWPARAAGFATFVAMLLLDIQIAVLIGVGLSLVLYVLHSAADVSVVELVQRPDGRIEEREPPEQLTANAVTVLDVYGHVFFAGARTLERNLPAPGADAAAVVLRLRGRTDMGATLVDVLSTYADRLERGGGRLYLSGLAEGVRDELARSGKLRLDGPVRVFEATPILGESTREAVAQAETWLVERADDG